MRNSRFAPRQFVISANYRDRSSANKWLVRRHGEPLESAVEMAEVHAKNVRFKPSDSGESGFGCTVVAEADEVNEIAAGEDAVDLRFDGREFVDHNACPHTEVAELHLAVDGKIRAVLMSA